MEGRDAVQKGTDILSTCGLVDLCGTVSTHWTAIRRRLRALSHSDLEFNAVTLRQLIQFVYKEQVYCIISHSQSAHLICQWFVQLCTKR